MLSTTAGALLIVGVLLVFGWIGIRAGRRLRRGDEDSYLTARGTQPAWPLALNFFASVLGAWILFAPPQVGTFAGILGVIGYAVGQAVAIAVFAYVGPQVRKRMPDGTTILEFVKARFGPVALAYFGGISVLYMYVFLIAELTAIGGAASLLADVEPLYPIIAVAAVTAAYTAYGGLPASLATDRWQGLLILGLVAAAAIGVAIDVSDPISNGEAAGLTSASRTGLEFFIVLVIAITAANLFHQGFWQRVWAARDDRALVRGALGAALLVIPVLFLLGLSGMVAAGSVELEIPSLAFFELLGGLPTAIIAVALALAVALVTSSVDTLQNALAATVSVDVAQRRLPMAGARIVTLLLMIPATIIATEGIDVLRLFLVADLLAATIALPVFLGLWWRPTTAAALAGAFMGLVGIVAAGWILGDSISDGFRLVSLPAGTSTLGAFVGAVVGSLLGALLITWAKPARRAEGALAT